MTNLQKSFPFFGGLYRARALAERALAVVGKWLAARHNRRVVAELMMLDDYMLRDIGVSRLDVEAALATPLFRDASWRLAERAAESRESARALAGETLRWARLMRIYDGSAPVRANERPTSRAA